MAHSDATRDAIAMMIDDYIDSGLMKKDFLDIEPKERLAVIDRLMRYRLPQLAAVDMNANITATQSFDEELAELANLQ